MNKVFLIGRLTKEIDLKTTSSGKYYCNFSIAINNGKDKDGNDFPADFPAISVFGKQAELCAQYLHKGMNVCILGKVKTGSRKNQDGTTSYFTNIQAENVEFLEWRDNKGQAAPPQAPAEQPQYTAPPQMPQAPMQQQMPQRQQMPQAPMQQQMPQMQQMPQGAPTGFTPVPEDYVPDFGMDPSMM